MWVYLFLDDVQRFCLVKNYCKKKKKKFGYTRFYKKIIRANHVVKLMGYFEINFNEKEKVHCSIILLKNTKLGFGN